MQTEQTEQIAALALEDGAVFYGRPFGAVDALARGRRGEVVFATGMTGYQEICTDPSYRGQMVVLTFPLIGNYGVTPDDVESRRPWLSALLVRECCDEYSNWRAAESLDDYLARNGIPGMCELDTRALTRHLRATGTLRGVMRVFPAGATIDESALAAEARDVRSVTDLDVVGEVSCLAMEEWETRGPTLRKPLPQRANRTRTPAEDGRPRVLVIDTGYKRNIARCLSDRGLSVLVAPHDTTLATIEEIQPDGVLLSNGPGDPESVAHLVELVRELMARRIPVMGICLGHQVIGLAAGGRTSRLPFGHHGANHPVREVRTGKVTVTSQNHNFQVDAQSIPLESGFYVSHINLSDDSVEGLAHEEAPIFSVQFHPEAAPGPEDNRELFDRFADMIARERARAQTPVADDAESPLAVAG